ncbi:hypothetical protein PMAYCL1PPCAC_30924, partial [Pristionchus mayeri]
HFFTASKRSTITLKTISSLQLGATICTERGRPTLALHPFFTPFSTNPFSGYEAKAASSSSVHSPV